MPGKEGEPPTPQQLKDLRETALNRINEIGRDSFSNVDVTRLSTSDHYVTRFWLHVFDLPGDQLEEACTMIIETFKWRKEFGVDKITYESLNQSMFDKGTVFAHNRDKDQKKLLVFTVGRHVKGQDKMDEMKRFFVYYLERLDREERGEEITIMFDCRSAGLKNMDMEFIQFIIGVFKDYYPQMLNYILVFEMPWVLNAAWKVIKAWLPAAAVKKIKFLTKSNVGEYIDDNNRLECWGGSDDWEYVFEPETFHSTIQEVNGNMPHHEVQQQLDDLSRKKSVTFAEVRASPSTDSFTSYSSVNGSSANGTGGPDILKLNPSQEVVFNSSGGGELLGRVQVTNVSERRVGFKIKTTSPEKYRVRPSSGILRTGENISVELHVTGQSAPVSLVRDKFLVTVIYLDQDVDNSRLQELLKSTKPDGQYRLRCQLAGEPAGQLRGSIQPASASPPVDESSKQLATLLKKVNQLSVKNEELQSQLTNNFYVQIILLVLTFCLLTLVFFYLPPSIIKCEREETPESSSHQEL